MSILFLSHMECFISARFNANNSLLTISLKLSLIIEPTFIFFDMAHGLTSPFTATQIIPFQHAPQSSLNSDVVLSLQTLPIFFT